MSEHDMQLVGRPGKGLVYNGIDIRDKGEMLSLTDMWRAAGADGSRQPANWTASADGTRFIEYATDILNPRNSGNELVKSVRGGRQPGTWAHWQIGLAYAKYLSPEFHMWCNAVVRAHMGGKPVGTELPAGFLEQMERSFGIIRMVAHKVTEIEKSVPGIVANLIEPLIAARLAEKNMLVRHGKTAKQIWDAANLPKRIKGSTNWFGNRLTEMGCGAGKADRGDGAIRMFDPDKAEVCLRNGLRDVAHRYADQRGGQTYMKLVVS